MPDVIQLVKSNCKDCHKCIRVCPVKAIRFTGHQAHIIGSQCIYCGQCFMTCPHEAKEIIDGREVVKVLMQQSEGPVIASLDPSFIAFFGTGIEGMREPLKKIGFSDVEEAAIGATLVKKAYENLMREGTQDVIISTQCQTIVTLIEKYYPDLISYMAPVVSPMVAHAMDIKRRMPDARVVYIGPCVSKKFEQYGTPVDAMLTFEEMEQVFQQNNVEIVPQEEPPVVKSRERGFCLPGGIIDSMDIPEDSGYSTLTFDGIYLCKSALEDVRKGDLHKCFLEMSSCRSSCVGGPIMKKYHDKPVRNYQLVENYMGSEDFEVPNPRIGEYNRIFTSKAPRLKMPMESEIREILKSLGRNTPEQELNCGTCGYDTCREKAIAIYRGIADPNMCLPFILDTTRSFQNSILDNTPNGVVILNEDFEIQVINRCAMDMMNIHHESDVLGENVIRILDPTPFFAAYSSGKSVQTDRKYFSDYNKYLEQTIVVDKTNRTLLCFLRDVTDEEESRITKEQQGRATVETADKVIDKQMRIVQEIASLLGETAAETKIALTKLKESIDTDEDE